MPVGWSTPPRCDGLTGSCSASSPGSRSWPSTEQRGGCSFCRRSGQTASARRPSGHLRVAYFSPDGPNVDVYVDGGRSLSSIGYKTVTTYQALPAGSHRVDFRGAGSDPAAQPIASATATLAAGSYRTVAAAGKAAALTAVVFDDGFTEPAQGKAQIRAIHFAPEVPAVDIAIKGGPVIFSGVGFDAATGYSTVASG